MKSLLLVTIFLSTTVAGLAQTKSDDVRNVSTAMILSPGFSYEHKIGRLQTLKAAVSMAASFGYTYSSSLGSEAYLYFDPAASLAYRYYFNYRQRSEKGKRTDMNSLNYIGPMYNVVFTKAAIKENSFEENEVRGVSVAGVVWGMQRNYRSRFSLDLNLGLGYQFGRVTQYDQNNQIYSSTEGSLYPMGTLTLGIWLNRRNS